VLAAICTYTDELGRTFVSQARIASDLGISRPAVNRQVRRLMELGYLVYARKQYKGQTTNTVKVVYDKGVKTEAAARSNLTAKEQMELAEAEAGLDSLVTRVTPDVTGTSKGVTSEVTGGVTLDVTGGVTSEVTLNETYNESYNDYRDEARKLCVMFQRVADGYGTPRAVNERDFDTMQAWVRQGLTHTQWARILADHAEYCRSNGRDMARAIGYFRKPVERVLGTSGNTVIDGIVKRASRGMRA